MSLKGQIAFGKNIILQRECEQTCNKYKNNLKQSRRRINNLEEDCVTSLYHLLLDAKGSQGNDKPNADSIPETKKSNGVVPRRAKSAVHGHRPASTQITDGQDVPLLRRQSTTSLKNYQISYSFVKDGMDISSAARKENKRKAIKNARTETNVSNRGDDKQSTVGIHVTLNDKTAEFHDSNNIDNNMEEIDTCISKAEGLLNRPQIKNTLKSASFAGGPSGDNGVVTLLSKKSENRSMTDIDEVGKRGHFQIRPATVIGHAREAKPPENVNEPNSQGVFKVTKLGENDSNKDASDFQTKSPKEEPDGEDVKPLVRDSKEETEIIDDNEIECDQNQLLTGVTDQLQELQEKSHRHVPTSISRKKQRPKSTPNLRSRSRKKSTGFGQDLAQEDLLQQTAERTQGFLKDYAKKSKLFSYVVNANTSKTAPRDRKIYRSPNVTYQELVSIKAGIKKQLLQTRVILQKSARLSSYVNKISSQVSRRAERLEQL